MKVSDIIQDVTIRANSVGVDDAVRATEQLAKAGDAVIATTAKVEKTLLDAGRAYDRLQRDIDINYRMQQNFERGQRTLDRALQQNKISTEAYDRSLSLLTAKYNPASVAADKFGASVKASSVQVGGIAAQFQDVAVQLAGGQSPFLIALQQGTQLSGQLEQTGGGVKALGAAFLSLFSPMSLLTIGGIAAFGTLVQYITSAGDKVDTLDDRLQAHADVIGKIKDAYGEAAEGLGKYAAESTRVLDLQLRQATQKLRADLNALASELANSTTKVQVQTSMEFGLPADLAPVVAEATTKFKAFSGVLVELRNNAAAGTPNIAAFRDEVARIAASTTDTGVQKLGAELLAMSDNAYRAEQALGGSARAIGVLSAAASSGLVALNGFNAALRTLQMGVPEMAKALTAQKDLNEANDSYRKGLADAKVAYPATGATERALAAATELQTVRVRELDEAFRQRVRTITGANDLEKDFGKTLQSTVISGLEGEARGIAQARAAYDDRNQKIEDSIRLGMSDAEATGLRAANEKILAQELKNVAAANKAKASSGGSSSGSDAFDNALQRSRDTIEELRQQQEAASKTTVEVYRLTEANRLRRAAASAGRADEAGITDAINAQAEAYARQRKATEDAIEVQKRYQESVKFTADLVTSFVEDVLTGSLESALKSVGKSFLSASLDALVSGKGPLAGAVGLAGTKDQQGGILGVLAGLPKAVEKGARQGTTYGSIDGIVTGIDIAGGSQGAGNLFGIDSKQLAGGLTAIAGLAGAYGVGMSAGSVGQALGGGAISGAVAGASLATGLGMAGNLALPGIGLVIGAGLAYFGKQQADQKRREELRRQAEENYKQAAPQIASLGSQLRGDPQNTLRLQIAEAEAAARKLGDVAFFAGRTAEQHKLYADFVTYQNRVIGEFRDGFAGFIDAMNVGLGPNSPFASAKSNIKDLGVELLGFIDNAKLAFGDGAGEVEQARQASIAYALATLEGQRSLSLVQTRMQEINGTAAGLAKVLADLGMSSDAAAAAIASGTTAALARLKTSFETDLSRRTLDAQDKGYINETADLFTEIVSLYKDAAALGTSASAVNDYFQAAAQAIVDGAQLTGDAFDDLIRRFPDLNGHVREFQEAIDAASRAADIAARRLGYQDRLFNALNDTDTLAGQLAAYDRTAMREREEEIKAGGEAIADLEAAQLVERFNIIRDFNKAANDNYRQSLQQAQDYVARFRRSITEYLDGLRAGADSALSPQARFAAAQSQFDAQYLLAQGGDRDALDGITSYAGDLRDAARAFYASSTGFQLIDQQIQTLLAALPDQISAEQFIVNAIEAGADQTAAAIQVMQTTLQAAVNSGSATQIANALSTYFNELDRSVDGIIDFNEMSAALGGMASNSSLRDMFTRLDTDNSGGLTRLELIKNATQGAEIYSLQTKQVLDNQTSILNAANSLATTSNSLTQTSNSLIDFSNLIANNQAATLAAIQGLQNTSTAQLQLLNSQLITQTNVNVQGVNVNGNLVDNIKKVVFNTAMANQRVSVQGSSGAVPYSYARGGYVDGPGTSTSDSISARLSNGEFVMRAAAVDRFGVGMLDRMNDNLAMPAVAVPVPVGAGGGDMRAVVAELRALRAELAAHKAATVKAAVAGAEHVREGVDEVAASQRDTAREMRVKAA